ncbi:MAG: hypothetical protein IID46_14290 [Planctomycetes bacterium]|nr:hypothetical protein [Planctomycetota bacterium]
MPHKVYGSVARAAHVIEASKHSYGYTRNKTKASILETKSAFSDYKRDIDVSWLAAAAETYQISPDIRDYIIVDIPSVTVDIPFSVVEIFGTFCAIQNARGTTTHRRLIEPNAQGFFSVAGLAFSDLRKVSQKSVVF